MVAHVSKDCLGRVPNCMVISNTTMTWGGGGGGGDCVSGMQIPSC